MRFSKDYSKLDEPNFTTIRRNTGFYNKGMKLTITTPTKKFDAKIWMVTPIRKVRMTEELARSDADCSRSELIAMLDKWYGKDYDDFVLINLMKTDTVKEE